MHSIFFRCRPALVLLLLALPVTASAQSAWTIYNSANSGLPFDAVNCIAFDNGGVMWIGTESGLASFDGISWTVYNTANSGLPDNAIRSLLIDADDNKWVGTFLGGLARFDGTAWTVYDVLNSALPDNHIKALALDTSGNKWIGTVQGLVRFDDTVFTVYDLSNAPFELSDNIADIHIDSNNVFRIGTLNGGLVKIVDTTWTVYTIPNGSGIPDNTQLEVDPDANGVEWMATPSNGLVAHPGGNIWLVYSPFTSMMPSSAATSLEILANPDRIWVGTNDKGLVRKTGSAFVHFDNTNSPFPDNYATFVEHDAGGMLWIGTQSGGLVRLDESLLTYVPEQTGPVVRIYPNPATRQVEITGGTARIEAAEVTDAAGRKVFVPLALHGGILTADLTSLSQGMYVVRAVFAGGQSGMQKLIKSKTIDR